MTKDFMQSELSGGEEQNRKEDVTTYEDLLKLKEEADDVIKKMERERTAPPTEEKIPFMSRVKKFFGG